MRNTGARAATALCPKALFVVPCVGWRGHHMYQRNPLKNRPVYRLRFRSKRFLKSSPLLYRLSSRAWFVKNVHPSCFGR